jgi:hypothetical protein
MVGTTAAVRIRCGDGRYVVSSNKGRLQLAVAAGTPEGVFVLEGYPSDKFPNRLTLSSSVKGHTEWVRADNVLSRPLRTGKKKSTWESFTPTPLPVGECDEFSLCSHHGGLWVAGQAGSDDTITASGIVTTSEALPNSEGAAVAVPTASRFCLLAEAGGMALTRESLATLINSAARQRQCDDGASARKRRRTSSGGDAAAAFCKAHGTAVAETGVRQHLKCYMPAPAVQKLSVVICPGCGARKGCGQFCSQCGHNFATSSSSSASPSHADSPPTAANIVALPRFSIFENTRGMTEADARQIARELGQALLSFDSGKAGLSVALRDRWYWTNLPLDAPESRLSFLSLTGDVRPALLCNCPAIDARVRFNCLTTGEGVSECNKLNAKTEASWKRFERDRAGSACVDDRDDTAPSSGPDPEFSTEEWSQQIKRANLVWQRSRAGMWLLRPLSTAERESMMGLPAGWCAGMSTTVAAKQLGNAWHVPTIELLLAGFEDPLRAAVEAGQIGTITSPLVVISFFDGIGGGWCALQRCLKRWNLAATTAVTYIAIENDKLCQRVLRQNFQGCGRCQLVQWGDIEEVEREILVEV